MILLGLALTAAAGWLNLPRRLETGLVGGLSMGFLAASFGLSVELFLFALVGLPFHAGLALAPWIVGAVWLTWRSRPTYRLWLDRGAWVALIGMGLVLALWLPMERAMPLTSQSWDAWAIWLFKAKAFFVDGDIATYLSRSGEFVGQPGYPLLTPLYSLWLYEWSGQVADQGAKLASPCYWLAALGAAWWVLRRLAGSTAAGIATTLIALTPMVQRTAFDWAGYADTALSAYFVAAAGLLVLWIRDKRTVYLAAGSLAATAAAWTKNEGQVFLAVFVVIAAAVLVSRRERLGNAVWIVAPPALLLGTWAAVRSVYGVEAAGFTPGIDFSAELFQTATTTLAAKAFAPSRFLLTFPLFIAAMALAAAQRASLDRWVPGMFAASHVAAALLAYATGRNEIQWWLETSADRVLAQIAPLAVTASAIAVAPWLSEAFAVEQTQPADDSAPVSAAKDKKRKQQSR